MFFKCGFPACERNKLFVCAVVVALALVQRRDLRHLIIRQTEIQNVEIVPDVIHVPAAGNHGKAHLRMPAEDDLRGRLAVLCTELSNIAAGRGVCLAPGFLNDHSGQFAWIPFDCSESFSCVLCTHKDDRRPSLKEFLTTLQTLYAEAMAFPL